MNTVTTKRTRGVVAPLAVRRAVEALVGEIGEAEAGRRLGIAPQTVPRFLAGMPVLANTLFAVSARLRVNLAGVIAVEGDVSGAEEDGAEMVATTTAIDDPEATRS